MDGSYLKGLNISSGFHKIQEFQEFQGIPNGLRAFLNMCVKAYHNGKPLVDDMGYDYLAALLREHELPPRKFFKIKGLGPKTIDKLDLAGYDTVAKVVCMSDDEFTSIPGLANKLGLLNEIREFET